MKIDTSWTGATTDPYQAMMGLLSCLDHGTDAWIEIQKNGEQAHPIKKKNPDLENPFNWEHQYGTPRTEEALKNRVFFNQMEKELTEKWVHLFGTEEAVKKYQEEGIVSDGLFNGSVGCPVKIEDANKAREKTDGYQYGYWMDFWQPKDGIPYWVVDDSIDKVFVVCHTNNRVKSVKQRADIIRKAGAFMIEYANRLEEGQG